MQNNMQENHDHDRQEYMQNKQNFMQNMSFQENMTYLSRNMQNMQ